MINENVEKTSRKNLILISSLFLVIILAVVIFASNAFSKDSYSISKVEVMGVEYETNLKLSDYDGILYAEILVNSDNDKLVLTSPDEETNYLIDDFLRNVDTLIPGEYEVRISHGVIRFIVDGMLEE